jgi:hypothetical protein
MNWVRYARLLVIGLGVAMVQAPAHAIPGQTVEVVKTWIQANPSLAPTTGEMLLVRKADTAARRLIFRASPFPVGQIPLMARSSIIRYEEISLFDVTNGININRLTESLRSIYGPEIHQDYMQSARVLFYPQQPITQPQKLGDFLQGEIRQGERFAYWTEIATNPNGVPYTGRITVFLLEDVPKITSELQQTR